MSWPVILSAQEAERIRELDQDPLLTRRDIARMFEVSRQCVNNIVWGKTWISPH